MAKEKQKPPRVLTTDEAREIGKIGGIVSGESRREKKTLRETMELALQAQIDVDLTAMQAGVKATIRRWIDTGDHNSLNAIRDLIGEKPISKIDIEDARQYPEDFNDYMTFVKKGAMSNGERHNQEKSPTGAEV